MSSNLLKPRQLKNADKIALIPLASPVEKKIFRAGLKYIQKMGFKSSIAIDPTIKSYKHLFSCESAKKRTLVLHKLFKDKKINAVLSVRGGYGSAQMLPHLDWSLIRKHPKIFMGFSDLTALLVNIYQRSGLCVIHAPSLVTYGAKAQAGNIKALKSTETLSSLLKGEIINPFRGYKLELLTKQAVKNFTPAPLTGGNLAILTSLLGTIWDANFDNRIVFLEEVGEAPYRVHRMLMQLKLAGKFKRVKALVLGDFIDHREHVDRKQPGYEDVFLDIFKDCDFPILRGLPVGHGDLNLPVPLGGKARINKNQLEIIESAVIS